MKELIAIAKLKSNFSSFGYIHFKGGTAFAVNGDVIIESKHKYSVRDTSVNHKIVESYLSGADVIDNDKVIGDIKDIIQDTRDDLGDKLFTFNLTGKDYRNVTECVSNDNSNDNSKFTLNGVLATPNNIVAIDGRRLYLHSHSGIEDRSGQDLEKGQIIGTGRIHAIRGYLVKKDLKITIYSKRTVIETEDYVISVINLSGKFPNYSLFIPKSIELENEFSLKGDMRAVFKKLKPTIDLESNAVMIYPFEKSVFFNTYNTDFGGKTVHADCAHTHKGRCPRLKLNMKLMAHPMLIENESTLKYNSGLSPVMVNFKGSKDIFIIMPMKQDEHDDDMIDNDSLSISDKDRESSEFIPMKKLRRVSTSGPSDINRVSDTTLKANADLIFSLQSDLNWTLNVIHELIPNIGSLKTINKRVEAIRKRL